jgi:hypothetical protein
MEKLQPFIDKRRKDGVKAKTINLSLEAVRRILRLAAHEWRDELSKATKYMIILMKFAIMGQIHTSP